MRAPIVSLKHQANSTVSYVGTNVSNIIEIYKSVGRDVAEIGQNIQVGKKVFSVDVSVNFITDSPSATGNFSWMLVHLRTGQTTADLFGPTASEWSSIGISNGRNQVIKSYMGVNGTEDSSAIRYNVHIKIPKMWHRLREGDSLELVYNGSSAGVLSIGFRYKDYS